MTLSVQLAERGLAPDRLVRVGIRRLLAKRLAAEAAGGLEQQATRKQDFVDRLRTGPIAIQADAANAQHYEVPAEFFAGWLGPRLKYSCCWWDDDIATLAAAERAMLERTCSRAEIANGQRILELGCGWGSLALWIAECYPHSEVTAVSNSHSQRRFIEARASEAGLTNLRVITSNINALQTTDTFDRVVSVEMFEHLRNYDLLLRNIAGWLAPNGKLFVHIFCHRAFAYPFDADGDDDWMARHFFTGGIMPSDDLLLHFQRDLQIESRWAVNGRHYARTLEAWLARLDANAESLTPLLSNAAQEAGAIQLNRWRMFLLACAELFAYRGGEEWYVAHYRFARP